MRKKRSASIPPVAAWRADTLISIEEAAAFIAGKDRRPGDDKRSARDRASHWLMYNIKKKVLQVTRSDPPHVRIGALGRALRSHRFSDKFAAMPADPVTITDALKETAHIADSSSGLLLPSDIPRCHEEIKRLTAGLDAANRRNATLEREAARWRELVAKNSASAKRPRAKR